MNIPDALSFKTAMHARLARGGSMYVGRNDEFGINVTDHRKTSAEPWTRTFTVDALPGREFASLREVRAAVAQVQVAA